MTDRSTDSAEIKPTCTDDYDSWDKTSLVKRLQELDQKTKTESKQAAHSSTNKKGSASGSGRPFDFSKHRARHIALKVSYIGDAYHGFSSASSMCLATSGEHANPAVSAGTTQSLNARAVEDELFRALLTARLVPAVDRCGWSRCGRTDKGVSAFGQVVSLWMRTSRSDADGTKSWDDVAALSASRKAPKAADHENKMQVDAAESVDQDDEVDEDAQLEIPDQNESASAELPYLTILNRLLPSDIRVLAWSPVADAFDARFSCAFRRYYYYFDGSGLDVDAMRRAASLFVGTHDCRHICKIDPSKAGRARFFERTIYESRIMTAKEAAHAFNASADSRAEFSSDSIHEKADECMFVFMVRGRAFLWHQVRNMMAILFLVGRKLEAPEVVSQMLDLNQHPVGSGRPQYDMAPDGPLVLVECGFPDRSLRWRVRDDSPAKSNSASVDARIADQIEEQWRVSAIRTLQLETLSQIHLSLGAVKLAEQPTQSDKHVPLMKRKRCDSVEDVVLKSSKSRRIAK